jgi:IclR family acetate operon transcriptional repressor
MLKEREMGSDIARPRQSVQSVERTLDLLEALAAAQGEISITNLAQRTGLHVSTVHRLLATLVHRGYVRQNRESSRYYLGSKLALLGEGAPRYTEMRLQAQTALAALTDLIDETSNLVVLEDTAAVYIDQVQCKQVVRLFTAIGNRVPLQCTAAGKVLLSHLPADARDRIVERLDFRSYTPRTIASRSALLSALETARRNGYALDEEEYQTGVRCVAVPVFGTDGQAIAAISVSAPAHRLPRPRAAEILPAMKRAAAAVTTSMGAAKR